MRPNHSWTFLHMSVLAGLLLTLNAESGDSDCVPLIKVRRNTVYNTSLGVNLWIECPVTFCNSSQPPISWNKFGKNAVPVNFNRSTHIKTERKFSTPVEGISFLIFQNIQKSDSGQYRCKTGGSVSHLINVYVYDNAKRPNDTQKNVTAVTSELDHKPLGDQWMYVYSAAGIVGFVVIVTIISVISMRGCKGTPKKETHTENQYIVIPMDEQPASHERRGGPSVPSSRRSTRKKTRSSEPDELPREHVYGMIKDDQETQRNMVEDEASSVVYAALNHQLPRAAPVRPPRLVDESSEYAAIRVS
ncbi:B- and T-lymphocyte attenuator-like [Scomber scombrus]|uniref:B- and T-lymphocyte attenuator-like n=1 Tax=Scomber scombrus TaxID=13677 RepID=UPI002DDBEB93|nr:B- and T-lymphocyte attenuator-like [Scomber scombrus]